VGPLTSEVRVFSQPFVSLLYEQKFCLICSGAMPLNWNLLFASQVGEAPMPRSFAALMSSEWSCLPSPAKHASIFLASIPSFAHFCHSLERMSSFRQRM